MSIFTVIIGTVLGALAGCGVGGGTLLLLYMTALGGVGFSDAKWINLLFFTFTAIIALISHVKNKLIDYRTTIICSLCGIATAVPAAFFAQTLKEGALGKIFGALFIIAGIKELFAKTTPSHNQKPTK